MPNWWSRISGRSTVPAEQKSAPQSLLALTGGGS